MHIISALASGVSGAANGTAVLRNRGTSTSAVYYSDFAGSVHPTSEDTLALDSNGGAVVYVNQYVDVTVYDSEGAEVRSWTDAATANSVEYKGTAITGTDYDTSAQATGNPIDIESAVNLWFTKNAAPDWEVKVGATTADLPTWLGPLELVAYNVRAYGALGDGSTDDVAAINAAISAAVAAGGGVVYFPAGNYYVEEEVEVPADVSLLGAGASLAVLQINDATEGLINWSGTGAAGTYIKGLNLKAAVSNSGQLVQVSGAGDKLIAECFIDGTNNTSSSLVADASTEQKVTVRNCAFVVGSSTASAISASNHTGRWHVSDCRFVPPAAYSATNGIVYGTAIDVHGCWFVCGDSTSGTYSVYKASSTTLNATLTGNTMEDSGGATVTGFELGTYVAASLFTEDANNVPGQSDSNFTLYSLTVGVRDARVRLGSRRNRTYFVSNDDASLLLDLAQWGRVLWNKTGTTSITGYGSSTLQTDNPPEGHSTIFTIKAAGGAIASVATTSTGGVANHSMSNTNHTHVEIAGLWDVLLADVISHSVNNQLDT